MYHLIYPILHEVLKEDFDFVLSLEKPEKYGQAITKITSYYKFKGDGKEKSLILTSYPTSTAIDIKLGGKQENGMMKFIDKGNRNLPSFFVEVIMPAIMLKIEKEHDIEAAKKYWTTLAQKGFNLEDNKEKRKDPKNKKKGTKGKVTKKYTSKCDHCQNFLGEKLTFPCNGCSANYCEDCVKKICDGNFHKLKEGKEKFICNECVINVDPNTL